MSVQQQIEINSGLIGAIFRDDNDDSSSQNGTFYKNLMVTDARNNQ